MKPNRRICFAVVLAATASLVSVACERSGDDSGPVVEQSASEGGANSGDERASDGEVASTTEKTQPTAGDSDAVIDDVDPGPLEIPTPEHWVQERVAAAHERLDASEGGRVIKAAIDAHGGFEKWYSNRVLRFRFDYRPVEGGEGPTRDTIQNVDVWSARARHQMPDDFSAEFGWTGEKAWMTSEEMRELNPRFWSLTPYYFVGVPFVLADEGVSLELEDEWEFEGRTWQMVRATFTDGTGDASDDYYVVMVDKETRRVGGVRYIVTYPGFFPDGGHSPEKLLTYDGSQEFGGILFAESFRSFPWSESGPGEQIRQATMSEVVWLTEAPANYFEMPDYAIEQTEL